MKIKFHGAAREVGRSCIEVDEKYLLDCGLKVDKHEHEEFHQLDEGEYYQNMGYPATLEYDKIKAVFLSHAHLDHCGSLPLFNKLGMDCPIFCTKATKDTAKILLQDSLKIHKMKNELIYYQEHINSTLMNMKLVDYGKTNKFEDALFTFNDAGHIPGSATILLTMNGKSLLYSGDINVSNSNLLRGAHPIPKADILITETTYGNREHPDRKTEEERLLNSVSKVIERGGSVIIPAFAVGRAAEIIMLLDKKDFGVPIYSDGMAKIVCKNYLEEDLRDIEKYKQAYSKVTELSKVDRWHAMDHPGIFVTTSGMATGGPVLNYIKVLAKKSKNAIFFMGYQANGTNGRNILDHRTAEIDGKKIEIKCEVDKFDFSAHAGRSELISFIKQVNPRDLIFVHGDHHAMEDLAKEFEGKCKVHMPRLGEEVEVQ